MGRSIRCTGFLVASAAVGGLLSGCAFDNGMYNANRLARSAAKAEREGRTFEASTLWGQVVTKADSAIARHPHGKQIDRATVLRGVALARLGQCAEAIGPLGRVPLLAPGSDLAEEASLALGRCQLEAGDPAAGDIAFVRVLQSHNPGRRREAAFQHGRALRLAGRYEEAIEALQGNTSPAARSELLLALAGAGRSSEVSALADTLLAEGDGTRSWDSVLVTLGRVDPVAASTLVGRLALQPDQPPGSHARRLYEDGLRLWATDTGLASTRFREAAVAGAGAESGDRARLQLIRLAITRARVPADLGSADDSLEPGAYTPAVASEIVRLRFLVRLVRAIADSSGPSIPQGDLRLFLAAEVARDSLASPSLGGALFRRIIEQWPTSPYAPKALMAGQRLDPAWADSSRVLLFDQFGESPYVAFVRGEEGDGYRVLEDSLYAFQLAGLRGAGPAGAEPGVRGGRRPIEDDLAPGSRGRPQQLPRQPATRRPEL